MCSSVKCERYKKIGDFLEGSDSDVEFKCDNCLIKGPEGPLSERKGPRAP